MKKLLLFLFVCVISIDAQNYVPLHVGNTYQYLTREISATSGYPTSYRLYLDQVEITKDTLFNNVKYFWFSNKWIRYDSAAQKMYSICGDSDALLFDFNGSGPFTPSGCLISQYTNIQYNGANSNYFGQQMVLKGFTYSWDWRHGDSYWGEGIGLVETWYNSEYFGDSYSSKTNLIEAILHSDSSFIHKTYNYPAQIQVLQNNLGGNQLSFYLSVNHQFTDTTAHFTYIDKVYLNGFYKKDNDIIPIDSLIFSYQRTDARLFKMDLPLDTFYLNNGYTLYYKAIAKDKGLIPVYTSYPDTGYLSKTILSVNDKKELVTNFNLSQNYPNPFNPTTNISYYIPSESKVNITVYNALGSKVKELVSENKFQGNYEVKFDGAGLASGVYFVTLKAASVDGKHSFVSSKKMILMK